MRILIVSDSEAAVDLAKRHLARTGIIDVVVRTERVEQYQLRIRRDLGRRPLAHLHQALSPLHPPVVAACDLTDAADAELNLGDGSPLGAWKVTMFADSHELSERLRDRLRGAGFAVPPERLQLVEHDVVLHGGASPFARDLARLILAQEGIRAAERKALPDDTCDLQLFVRDPATACLPLRGRFEVVILSDDAKLGGKLVARLNAAGFTRVSVRPLSAAPDALHAARIALEPGPFRAPSAREDLRLLREAMLRFLIEHRIEPPRELLAVATPGADVTGPRATVVLPIRAALTAKPTRRGEHRERYHLIVGTDDPAAAAPLRDKLRAAGFTDVDVSGFSDLWDEGFPYMGYRVFPGAARRRPAIIEALRRIVTEQMEVLGASPAFPLHVDGSRRPGRRAGRLSLGALDFPVFEEAPEAAGVDVLILFPTDGIADGRLKARIADPSRFRLAVLTPCADDWEDLVRELGGVGFAACGVRPPASGSPPHIEFGGAPPELIDRVRALVRERTGLDLPARKAWPDLDPDISIFLGRQAKQEMPASRREGHERAEIDEWLASKATPGPVPTGPFLQVDGDFVRVGEIRLPRRAARGDLRVPDLASFRHYTICASTAAILHHLALSVLLREPCLLEGVTSTSKTSSIALLAAVANQPLYRINLDGQSDPGEIVGKFIPDDGTSGGGRRKSFWRWLDGLLVRAMTEGAWLLIDELNLAEPQILERMNPALEQNPTLVVCEHANEVIGRGGVPVHRDFRIFATMNPAEYAGRSQLSPAYLSRWRGHLVVGPPTEPEYAAMLRLLVFGRQPDITYLGRTYPGAVVAAPHAVLADVPGVDRLIAALARFEVTVEASTGQDGGTARIGAGRKERYVFTRRDLLSVMRCIAEIGVADGGPPPHGAIRMALARYYLSRLATEDRQAVLRLLDAAGIGPNTWSVS